MTPETISEADSAMSRAVEAMRREFATVRTGKATPALLDTVRVNAYGSSVPLKQVANVGSPEPNLLVVQPYDQNIAGEIGNAIRSADLGLNPSVDGNLIRVPVPPLSEERRKEMVKVLHRMAEEGRVSVRQVRQTTRNNLQEQQREGEVSEDEYHRLMDDLQARTDAHVSEIDRLLERKEAEVMEV